MKREKSSAVRHEVSPEQRFILSLLNGSLSGEMPIIAGLDESEWAAILDRACEAGVSGELHGILCNLPDECQPPERIRRELQSRYRLFAMGNVLMFEEIRRIAEAASEKQIEIMLIKGAAIAWVFRSDIGVRSMRDVDLVVREEHLNVTSNIVKRLGYRRNTVFHGAERKHLVYERDRFEIDLHWRLIPSDRGVRLDMNRIWSRATPREINGVHLWVPSPADMLLHLCLHVSHQHDFNVRLRDVWDIAWFVNRFHRDIDWDRMIEDSPRENTGIDLLLTLACVSKLFPSVEKICPYREFHPYRPTSREIDLLLGMITSGKRRRESAPRELVRVLRRRSIGGMMSESARFLFPPPSRLSQLYPRSSRKLWLTYPYHLLYIMNRAWKRRSDIFRFLSPSRETKIALSNALRDLEVSEWLDSLRSNDELSQNSQGADRQGYRR